MDQTWQMPACRSHPIRHLKCEQVNDRFWHPEIEVQAPPPTPRGIARGIAQAPSSSPAPARESGTAPLGPAFPISNDAAPASRLLRAEARHSFDPRARTAPD